MQNTDFKTHGYKTLSNSYGLEIMINETNEEVFYRYSNEGSDAEVYASLISYDQEGDPYFYEYRRPHESSVHYLNEFIKVNF